MSRQMAWIGILSTLICALLIYGGLALVYQSQQETCVRAQLAKEVRGHLSVWEAVGWCRR